jgi:hypothetical protein
VERDTKKAPLLGSTGDEPPQRVQADGFCTNPISSGGRSAAHNFMSSPFVTAATDIGRPQPSANILRSTPPLPQPVGLDPFLHPPYRSLGHAAISGKQLPINAPQQLAFVQPTLPECLKNASINPFPKVPVRRITGADLRADQRIPMHPRSQHQHARIPRYSVRNPRPVKCEKLWV